MSDEEKERIGITVSKENLAWLDSEYNNRSGYIDDLLTKARTNGGDTDAILRDYQKRQLEFQLKNHEQQKELIKEQLEELEQADTREEREYESSLDDLLVTLEKGGRVWPGHKLVEEVARDYGFDPDSVIDDLRERAGDGITDDQFEQP